MDWLASKEDPGKEIGEDIAKSKSRWGSLTALFKPKADAADPTKKKAPDTADV